MSDIEFYFYSIFTLIEIMGLLMFIGIYFMLKSLSNIEKELKKLTKTKKMKRTDKEKLAIK